jgi:hypothetical protein
MFVDVKKQKRDRIPKERKMNKVVAVVIILSVILGVGIFLLVINHQHPEMTGKMRSALISVGESKQNTPPKMVAKGTNGFRIEGLHATPTFAK